MEISTLSQLLEKQQTLAQKASFCQSIGSIQSIELNTDITSDEDFKVEVYINHYRLTDEFGWKAYRRNYGEDKDLHTDDEGYDAMLAFLDGIIDKEVSRAKTIVERCKNLFNM